MKMPVFQVQPAEFGTDHATITINDENRQIFDCITPEAPNVHQSGTRYRYR